MCIRDRGAALGDVPHPGARAGDVDRRACAVGGHLPHRAADALDARKPYARLVFDLSRPDNIFDAVMGKKIGTVVSDK